MYVRRKRERGMSVIGQNTRAVIGRVLLIITQYHF